MEQVLYSSHGWESWDVEHKPTLPEGMPILIDSDLRFEDGAAAPRPTIVLNRWLRELHERIAEQQASLDILTALKTTAISQLAAQHDELQRLRLALSGDRESRVHDLAASNKHVIGPC
ncbi:hypothetical protein AB0F17_14705 [Nonomuraea sp. NPDC026600]|uniref:hypothetical protein n=1 Tax=Nonomuraea sp. NPDC026600 TaxID=3155363 RepID=UPI00340EDAD8